MYCSMCGKEIPDDSLFCPECGAKQEPLVAPGMSGEEAKLKKRNKIIGVAVAAALGICVIIILLSAWIKPSVNLNKYLSISFEGYNTVGNAVVTFDREKFEADYGKKLNYNTDSFLATCVNGSLDKTAGLSNGDIVTYTWDCNKEKALSDYGFKLKYKDLEVTVNKLEEAKTFDPFEGIEVVFEGIAPNGSAHIEGEPAAKEAQDLYYEFDRSSGLVNGDSVTVTVSSYSGDPVEYCIQNYGMIPSPLSKTYQVENLDSYVQTISEISEESLKKMQAQAEDIYQANVAKNWSEEETLRSLTYIGNYLLVKKDSEDSWGNRNVLYLVYKAQVNDVYTNGEETYNQTNDIYWYTAYYDLLVNPEGVTTVDLTDYSTPGDSFTIDSGISSGWWSTKSWYYYGYETLEKLYKAAVIANSESYKHEDNVGEDMGAAVELEEEKADEKENGIIFPNSSREEITEKDAADLSDEELRYAINELYARHGYIFKDDAMRSYYENFDWYEETVASDAFSLDLFNDTERKNIEILQKERDRRN